MSVRADRNSTNPVEPSPLPLSICSPLVGTDRGVGFFKDRPVTLRSSISAPVVEQARAKFEQQSGRQYTEHEVREILGTLSDFVRLLIEWDQNPVPQAPAAQRIDDVEGTGA
jgi:hypothetical protein